MAVINVPAATYALCMAGPLDTTASLNGCVFAAGSSDSISLELTTVSTTNSSAEKERTRITNLFHLFIVIDLQKHNFNCI